MTAPETASADRFAAVFDRVRIAAPVFHTGPLCGIAADALSDGLGWGTLTSCASAANMAANSAGMEQVTLKAPAAILFPHAGNHRLVVGDDDAADIVCAKIDFGGPRQPAGAGASARLVLPLTPDDLLDGAITLVYMLRRVMDPPEPGYDCRRDWNTRRSAKR